MGIINKFASAALVLSFCGAVTIQSSAQEITGDVATSNSASKTVATKVANPFDKFEKKTPSAPAAAKQSSGGSETNWTGFYAGGYLGSNFSRTNTNTSTVFASGGYFTQGEVLAVNNIAGRGQINDSGFSGGAQGGYNYQSGSWVVGIEADFGANKTNKAESRAFTYGGSSATANVSDFVKTNWMMTVRPRVGFTWDRALFYATGGLALTDLNYSGTFTDTRNQAIEGNTYKEVKAGWTGGGGMEYKFNRRWSFKGEYLFADFGRVNTSSTSLATLSPTDTYPENPFNRSFRLKNHNLRFGVNFHF